MSAASLKIWHSPSQPSARGFEIAACPVLPRHVRRALDDVSSFRIDGSFLLIRLATTDHDGMSLARSSAGGFTSTARVCIAIDLATVKSIGHRQADDDRIGLVLDDVDADTPLSAITNEALEAIRFKPEFVVGAGRSLRAAAILRAIMGLAHDLGLGTLGQTLDGGTPVQQPSFTFDYVPMNAAEGYAATDSAARPGTRVTAVRSH